MTTDPLALLKGHYDVFGDPKPMGEQPGIRMDVLDPVVKAGAHKYRSRKRVGNKWVYDYGDDSAQRREDNMQRFGANRRAEEADMARNSTSSPGEQSKLIGHTGSGKPIYAGKKASWHKRVHGYTAQDHGDASSKLLSHASSASNKLDFDMHHEDAQDHMEATGEKQGATHTRMVTHHASHEVKGGKQATWHREHRIFHNERVAQPAKKSSPSYRIGSVNYDVNPLAQVAPARVDGHPNMTKASTEPGMLDYSPDSPMQPRARGTEQGMLDVRPDAPMQGFYGNEE